MAVEKEDKTKAEVLEDAIGRYVNGLITKRILLFHDALVERGQIKPIPPKEEWPIHQRNRKARDPQKNEASLED